MNRRNIAAAALAVCLTAGALVGCGGRKTAEPVIRIGVIEPLTGANGAAGFQEMLGIRYANQVYPTVTIGGETYAVKLVEADNKSDCAEAINAATKLASEPVSVVLGSYGSDLSIASGAVFAKNKIPAIGCSCTSPQVTEGNDFYFRVCFSDPLQGTAMANYAYQNNAKRAAVITQIGDGYSSGLGGYFKEAFSGLGGQIVSEQQFQAGQTDFRAILNNINAQNPDIIFAPSSLTAAPLIIRQARELGITAVIAAGDTWENSAVVGEAGAAAEGVVLTAAFDESEPANDEAAAFIKGFREYLRTEKQDEAIPAVSALGYDAYLAAIKAIEAADSTDPAAIREALSSVVIEGATGTIAFNGTGDANKNLAFIKVIRDGRFQFLTTATISR
ncbi:ABC transporter substrate-binding protein [Enterocloster asparagiformis]|uniref:ABC transporter substrate-binding protein n=1 Tax=Enterocloster asparagiformis TaxID=333367 RepID=UPI00046343BB|nr:ABC transporter substrate-binding protein [Enterocloster asparagiformis]